MNWKKHDYDDIPGTYVFDGQRAHPAYALNKLLYTFNQQQNRDAFDADPAAYCDQLGLNAELKEAVVQQDFMKMLRLGANIYYLAKMAVPRGMSVQDIGAAFQQITTPEFQQKLAEKGHNLSAKLETKGDYWHG
jgi:protocatechuate 4,5-dioxygenase alpha chain